METCQGQSSTQEGPHQRQGQLSPHLGTVCSHAVRSWRGTSTTAYIPALCLTTCCMAASLDSVLSTRARLRSATRCTSGYRPLIGASSMVSSCSTCGRPSTSWTMRSCWKSWRSMAALLAHRPGLTHTLLDASRWSASGVTCPTRRR